jgi:phage gp29-like protein
MFSQMWRRVKRRGLDREQAAVEPIAAWRLRGIAEMDDLLRTRGERVYDEMLTDAQVQASLTTKKFGILDAEWHIVPGGEDEASQRAADLVRFALGQLRGSVTRILLNALDALAHGYSVQEVNYVLCEQEPWHGMVIWQSVKSKPPRLFRLETDEFRNLKALYLHVPGGDEKPLPAEKFVVYSYNSSYESPTGRSDLRAAYKHWWAKQLLLKFWLLSLEKFGAPTVKGVVPRHVPEAERRELLEVLDRIQQETAVVLPEDVQIELLEGKSPVGAAYLQAVQFHNKEITRAILGQTLATDEGLRTGSLALGKVHYRVMQLYFRALRRDLAEQVMEEQLFRRLVELNFAEAKTPRFVWVERDVEEG